MMQWSNPSPGNDENEEKDRGASNKIISEVASEISSEEENDEGDRKDGYDELESEYNIEDLSTSHLEPLQ